MRHDFARNPISKWMLLAVLLALTAAPVPAGTPDWVTALRAISLPDYPPDTDAVVLLDEGRTVVRKDGEIRGYFRMAYKILTREATGLAWVRLSFGSETRISDLKAWNIKESGVVHEVKQKDATITQLDVTGGILYEDTKSLVLLIPQVEAGSIIAYEYEQRHRPYILQDFWWFQGGSYPVLRSEFELELPDGWTYAYRVQNHPDVAPVQAGSDRWVWKMENIPPVPDEKRMPPLSDIVPTLSVAYFPDAPKHRGRGEALETWDDVARWYASLMKSRAVVSGPLRKAAGRFETRDEIARFVQKEIRYVAIEIGIGGYQPHFAETILHNRFGDCKDKVTLLKTLLQTREKDLYPVLIHTGRRSFDVEFPSPLYFNHLIAAIPLRPEEAVSPAVLEHPELGRLLLFDPTDDQTPIGQLPAALQGVQALLIREEGGTVIETPLAAPLWNRRLRTGHFQVSGDGQAEGELHVLYKGVAATHERAWLNNRTHRDWLQDTERFVAAWLPGAALKNFGASQNAGSVTEAYEVKVPYFAQPYGKMLLIRPAMLGSEVGTVPERERSFPFRFGYLRSHGDVFEIQLPDGYQIGEVPEPAEIDLPFAHYRMEITAEGNLLKFKRVLEIRKLEVGADQVEAVRSFYRDVARQERTIVVARQTGEKAAAEISP